MGVLRASVIAYTDLQLLGWLLGLSLVSYIDLIEAAQQGRPFPPLYDLGVRYQREPPGSEVWQTIRYMSATKQADCEDLASARTAELWAAGETAARPCVKRVNPRLRHILVQRADGTIEDPSIILGMHRAKDPDGIAARRARDAVKPVFRTPHEPLPWGMPLLRDVQIAGE